LSAAAASNPTDDAYVRGGASAGVNYGSEVILSLYGSTAACTLTDWSFVKFTVADAAQVGRATLTLTVSANPSTIQAGTLVTLYKVTDGWTEGAITASNAPTFGAVIQSVAAPTTNGATVVFGDAAASSALSNYIHDETGADGVVSMALALTGTCGAQSSAVRFASSENTTVAKPSLELFNPTAVDMSTASAQQSTSWPLYAGLAAVVLLVAAGVTLTRRHTA